MSVWYQAHIDASLVKRKSVTSQRKLGELRGRDFGIIFNLTSIGLEAKLVDGLTTFQQQTDTSLTSFTLTRS